MDFRAFRELRGWSLAEAVAQIRSGGGERFARINDSTVSKHERGVAFPGPALIARYTEITEGAVTYADWVSLNSNPDHARRVRERWKGMKPGRKAPAEQARAPAPA